MSTDDVNSKARLLMEPVLGSSRTESVIQMVNNLEDVAHVRELVSCLTLSAEEMKAARFSH